MGDEENPIAPAPAESAGDASRNAEDKRAAAARRAEKKRAKAEERGRKRARKMALRAWGAAAAAAAVLLLLFLAGNRLLGTMFFAPRIDAAFLVAFAVLGAGLAWVGHRLYARGPFRQIQGTALPCEELVFLAMLGLVTLTTFTHHAGYHFLAWPLERKTLDALARSRMVHFLALSALLWTPFALVRSRRWLDWALPCLLIAAELLCAQALWKLTGGVAVWSDDHPSFLFRVQEFWHSLPWRENYVPHWNAGVVNSVISSSGTAGYALLTSPLRLLSPLPHETHTAGLFLVQAVIVPWTVVWGMRANRFAWRAAWTAGLLALFANRVFFLWAFHFGTVGFGTSVAFVPAAFLFLYAVAEKRAVTLGNIVGLAFSMTFLCQWPPMCLVAATIALAALTSWRRWLLDRRTFVALAVAAAVTLALLVPTLRSVAGGHDLIAFTTTNHRPFSVGGAFTALWRGLGDIVVKMHPVALVLGFGGLWTLQEKPLRRWLAIATLGIWAVCSIGTEAVPRMQRPRLVVASAMLAVVPTGVLVGQAWRDHKAPILLLQSALLALLLLGIPNVAKLYGGRGVAPFRPMPEFTANLAAWVRDNVSEGSRFLFAGRTQHAYGRGHVAYLPILAGREMMACDYYDFPPGTFEPSYPPKASRAEPGGMHAFMVRHGVSHVVAFRPEYVEYLRSEPWNYEPVPEFEAEAWGPFRVFRVRGSHGVFVEGRGRVDVDFNRLRVDFGENPPERAVIAYNWNDRLSVEGPAEIAPYETGTTLGRNPRGEDMPVRFIEIRPHGVSMVDIRYSPRF